MKRALLLLALSGALASCGVGGVGRLGLTDPGLTTNFVLAGEDGQPGAAVACNDIEGEPTSTQLRLTFTAADRLDVLRLQLRPSNPSLDDGASDATFKRDNGDFAGYGDNTRYKVVFNADPVGGVAAQKTKKARWQPLRVTVKPKAQTIKLVRVKPAELQGTFKVRLSGFSDEGQAGPSLESNAIALYGKCDLVGDTKKSL